MAISEKDLLEAGFSNREVDTLLGRLAATGGSMQGLIAALSRRLPGIGMDLGRARSGYAGHPHHRQPDTHSFLGHEFPRCPDHCLDDLSTGSWLESIPPAGEWPGQVSAKVIARNHLSGCRSGLTGY